MARGDGEGYRIAAISLGILALGVAAGALLLTWEGEPGAPVRTPRADPPPAGAIAPAPATKSEPARPSLPGGPAVAVVPSPSDAGLALAAPPADAGAGTDGGPTGSAVLAGYVHDRFRRPIAGAAVRLSRRGSRSIAELARFVTDADGRFVRRGLVAGPVLIEVRAAGFRPRTLEEIQLVAEETRELEILLQPGRRLSGRVVDDTGEPVAAVEVTAVPPPSSDAGDQQATSDAEGRFAFTELGEGPYCLHGRKAPYADADQCGVRPGAKVTLKLLRTGGLAGKVVRALGFTPVTDFRVAVRTTGDDDDSGGPVRRFRNRDGSFRFTGLRPGTYRVIVVAHGRMFAERAGVQVLPGETTEGLSFELDAAGRIRGQVLAVPDNAPVVGAVVELLLAGRFGSKGPGRRRTDEEGRFEFEEISVGRHQLNVEHPGYRPILLHELTVPQSRGETVLLRMRRESKKKR